MNDFTKDERSQRIKKACQKCGLIQMYDEIWGLVFCDANQTLIWGCPDKELILERFPDSEYDESKIIPLLKTRPYIFKDIS